jgi:hypothetical protein
VECDAQTVCGNGFLYCFMQETGADVLFGVEHVGGGVASGIVKWA